MRNRGPTTVDVIRDQHWLELSDYLGVKPAALKSTMKLWFTILSELGYDLVATGVNRQVPRASRADQPPALPEVPYTDMYHAVEEALIDIASRRSQGERISDQAEVRVIVARVLACIADIAGAGTASIASGRSDD